MAQYLVPASLRKLTGGQATLEAAGATVLETLNALAEANPGLGQQIMDASGNPRPFVNFFLNGDDIRMHEGFATAVQPGDEIELLPAIAGGDHQPKTFTGMRDEFKAKVPEIDADGVLGSISKYSVVDVRTADEFAQGHVPGAIHCDRGFLEMAIEEKVPDKNAAVLVYCQSGVRSLFAARTMQMLGYSQVASMAGGVQAWKEAGGSLVIPPRLSETQRQRYLRHTGITEVGEAGQHRLLQSRVLMIGAGGLGCPSALYLAAAGVGTLGIVDNDVVDLSNLQRQVLHKDAAVGQPKVESAREAIAALNPDVTVEQHSVRLGEAEADELFPQYDLIVDGSDNFLTRYNINDAAVRYGKPVVHGSVYRFEGQVSVFGADGGPCYRCLYPEAPPAEFAPSCAEAGVLGVLPGVIGLLQATEALKLLLGIGEPLVGRALRFDGLQGKFHELRFPKDEHCPSCGDGSAAALTMPGEAVCAIPNKAA